MSTEQSEGQSAAATLIDASLVWENHCCMPFENTSRWMPQTGAISDVWGLTSSTLTSVIQISCSIASCGVRNFAPG